MSKFVARPKPTVNADPVDETKKPETKSEKPKSSSSSS